MRCPPVVFFIFNRPEQTAQVFGTLHAARPAKLLVVADGPRAARPGEAKLCEQTREILDGVDWPCRVLRNFSDINLGCGRRVASGMDWAFEQVEEAIILEDDCLPDPSFFGFCAESLERYRHDDRIMMISGDNFQNGRQWTSDSYYFSRIPHCWGWATWRRAWHLFDFEMSDWPQHRSTRWLKNIAMNPMLAHHWTRCFDAVRNGEIDTWDYQWMYCMFRHNGLSIVPEVNLVTNIGFGGTATHTLAADDRHVVASHPMTFPLRHPGSVHQNTKGDLFESEYLHRLPRLAVVAKIYPGLRSIVTWMRPFLERIGLWAHLRALEMALRPQRDSSKKLQQQSNSSHLVDRQH
jgi:hypothetical protein